MARSERWKGGKVEGFHKQSISRHNGHKRNNYVRTSSGSYTRTRKADLSSNPFNLFSRDCASLLLVTAISTIYPDLRRVAASGTRIGGIGEGARITMMRMLSAPPNCFAAD